MRFTVAFDEADGEGIVFFGNYFRLAHRALEAYLPTISISWSEWFKSQSFGVPLRHVEADYFKPLKPGDVFEAAIRVAEIGENSVSFDYEFKNPDGQVIARLKTAHVFVSRSTFLKCPVPESLRLKLSAAIPPA